MCRMVVKYMIFAVKFTRDLYKYNMVYNELRKTRLGRMHESICKNIIYKNKCYQLPEIRFIYNK